jgi:hypothetical protein
MATTAKPRTPTKRAASLPVAPARTRAAGLPFLRFYHSKQLREKTEFVLAAVETESHHAKHTDAVADLVTELIEAGMDY